MANAPKKKSLFDSLKNAVLEQDGSTATEDAAPTPAAPPAMPSFSMPTASVAPQVQPASAAASVKATPSSSPVSADVDEEALKTIKANVYVDIRGRPSHFMRFIEMWTAQNRPSDLSMVLNGLRVFDKSITQQTIIDDLAAHELLLDNTTAHAKSQFEAVAKETLGGADTETETLLAANETAAKEIERHQREITERTARLTAIKTARAEDEAKIQRAYQRTAAAEAVVRAELQGMKHSISAIRA